MSAKRGCGFLAKVLASAAVAVLILASASVALAQGRRDREEGRPPRDFRSAPDRPPPRGFESSRGFDAPQEATVKTGFLFLDGEYLSPPYEIRFADDSVTVNGRKLTCIPPPPDSFGYGRGFGGPPRGEQSWRSLVGRLH